MCKVVPCFVFQRCSFCGPVTGTQSQPSACIQCSHGRCTQAFHTTCAYAAGVQFEISDWPYPIYCTCLKHQNTSREKVSASALVPMSAQNMISGMPLFHGLNPSTLIHPYRDTSPQTLFTGKCIGFYQKVD